MLSVRPLRMLTVDVDQRQDLFSSAKICPCLPS
uniref:Uncharacterized protein n=2 Tax=Anguilla anguilla TaxID=7936 RepID=A0A0E9P8P8_ANGAN